MNRTRVPWRRPHLVTGAPRLISAAAFSALLLLWACRHASRDPRTDAAPAVAPPLSEPAAAASPEGLLAARGLMVPVDGVSPARVPDTYLASRGERSHNALDILAPRGTAVLAAEAGRVFRLRSNPSGGITVYAVDRDERFMYYYAHLERYRDGLREGLALEEGDVIGFVGTTGNAPPDTPHLHFQLMKYRRDGKYWDGTPINPHPYLKREGAARAP